MSSSTPTPPLPITTTAPLTTAGSPPPSAPVTVTAAGSPTPPAPVTSAAPTTAVFTPEEVTSILRDLVTAVQGIHLYLVGPAATTAAYGHPALPWPSQGAPAMGGPPLPPFQAGHPPAGRLRRCCTCPDTRYPRRSPGPIRRSSRRPPQCRPGRSGPRRFSRRHPRPPQRRSGRTGPRRSQPRQPRRSSSHRCRPAPDWAIYTEAGDPPVPTLQSGASSGSAGAYDGLPTVDQAPSSSLLRTVEPVGHGAPTQTPPRFAKIDFATYDGTEDPLNWLKRCEQFFRGQRTLASERTWLASYHLRGAA
nr:proline-rich receptor-like protein kinase PERK8 [Aegilops tauschii subsp. strangulata]